MQSTTRYRKGTGAKKFMKSENPAPSRQSSGRKGGISASKTKLQRQGRERCDPRRSLLRSHFSSQTRPHAMSRQSSPLTPPSHENMPAPCNPYFFGKPDQQMEVPYEEMCGLEDVQGVYIDDHGPVFTNSQDGTYCSDGLPRY